MLEAWVAKQWNLRGHVIPLEMERSIPDLVFHGLINRKGSKSRYLEDMESLEGKLILVINGGTVLGNAISSFLISKGARLTIYADGIKGEVEFPVSIKERSEKVRFYSAKEYGQMTPHLFKQIFDDIGPIDIVIQDLGISDIETTTFHRNMTLAGQGLVANFSCAQDLASSLETEMTKRGSGRVLYLAPWAWDRYADLLQYEIVKAGTIALTKTLTKRTAASMVNVNCIVPGYIGGIEPLRIEREKTSEVIDHIPMGCLGELPDIVKTAYFLISGDSKYLTGQVLELAGGID